MPRRVSSPPAIPQGRYEKVPVDKLLLDAKNPRLAEFGITEDASQFDLLKLLWNEMAVDEVAMSIAQSGYWEHEPLLVERDEAGKAIVIEGNRRLAAAKLLLNSDLRKRAGATDLPSISAARRTEIESLPVIFTTRKQSWQYLGFKHVNGPSTWGSYAKAQYIVFVHNTFNVPLADIAKQIGDYHSTVQRMYRGLMIIDQAERERLFERNNTAKSKFHFNYIYSGMDYPGISSFLGLEEKGSTKENPVPKSKTKNLGDLLRWLYGDRKSGVKSLIKSQNPDLRTLDSVLLAPSGVQALRDNFPLTVALDISLGDEKLFTQAVKQSKLDLQKAHGTLTTGFNPEDLDTWQAALDVERLASELVGAMSNKKSQSRRGGARRSRKHAQSLDRSHA